VRHASCCYPAAAGEAATAEEDEEEAAEAAADEEEASSQIMNEDLCAIFLGVPDGWPTRVRIECAP
jgi:hypothetical protein